MNLFRDVLGKKRGKPCCTQLGDISNLRELRKITFQLGTKHGGNVPYFGKEKNGVVELKIYEQSNIEILYISAKSGIVFPEHTHTEAREMLVISSGTISLEIGPLTTLHKEGEFLYLEMGQKHKVTIIKDSIILATFLKVANGVSHAGN